jgi:hypothetical protein
MAKEKTSVVGAAAMQLGEVKNLSGAIRVLVAMDAHRVVFTVPGKPNRQHASRDEFTEWLKG